MSKEVVFIKPLAWPHYPMESVKVHARWVAHVGLKRRDFYCPLPNHKTHTNTHKCTRTGRHTTQQGQQCAQGEIPVALALLLKKDFLEYFWRIFQSWFSNTPLSINRGQGTPPHHGSLMKVSVPLKNRDTHPKQAELQKAIWVTNSKYFEEIVFTDNIKYCEAIKTHAPIITLWVNAHDTTVNFKKQATYKIDGNFLKYTCIKHLYMLSHIFYIYIICNYTS